MRLLPLLRPSQVSIPLSRYIIFTDEPVAEVEDNTPKKISFSVKLLKFDESKKIGLIKEIRNVISGLNLVQAKKFVEGAPAEVKKDLGKNEAEELKALLESQGGTVEIV